MSRQAAATQYQRKTLDNKYMLGDEIGKGAYGRVYKGLDLENGDFVAIKQVSLENIPQEDLSIIMQEIDLLKNLNHKNIVTYLGSIKTKTHLHIILEYVENGSLANIIKPNKFGPFPESLVAVYISQVLEGLAYLHDQGVIHRDIKGANILTTKEGLVKLADFGVATKLTEADMSTYSVVGTPYWMAPEVIEMSGVSAASDIWSVGCTVIELLTCVPPYYDLQPMPALFRIVQDVHPPIPEGLSPGITDFLCQCFRKDSIQRPDAKTLLLHPWIQNSRRILPTSLRQASETIRNIEEDATLRSRHSNVDNHNDKENLVEKAKIGICDLEQEESKKEQLTTEYIPVKVCDDDKNASFEQTTNFNGVTSKTVDVFSAKDPTLVIYENPSSVPSAKEEVLSSSVTPEGKGCETPDESSMFAFQSRDEKNDFHKSNVHEVNELSRFSDTEKDASLDDLFQPLNRKRDQGAEASSNASVQQTDLAKELKARIAQKQMEPEQTNGGKLLEMVMNLQDVIDIDGSAFDDNLPADNLFPVQVLIYFSDGTFRSVEFSKVIGSLEPEASEEELLSACQRLLAIFTERPEQKHVYMSQHGFLPLMDLLETPKTRVMCSVLQIINFIIKDNTDFQENACLVGLIPVVMHCAVPDRPREVRTQAAIFLQHLCKSRTLTLQMFIACRGIPVLVSFLEADYAKYREMVHLSIDSIWEVFKLQNLNRRDDFCQIAAQNGILIRLVNTLYSLNEATRLACISLQRNGSAPRSRSGPLESHNRPAIGHFDSPVSNLVQIDPSKPRPDNSFLDGTLEQMRNHVSLSQRQDDAQLTKQHSNGGSGGTSHPVSQQENIRPLLSLLEKEAPSRHVSGQLDCVQHLSGYERHESILPLLQASTERRTNGELDSLVEEFEEVSRHGRKLDKEFCVKLQNKTSKRVPPILGSTSSNEGTSTSGLASQTTSGVLSGSGVLNARPGSTTSSGLLSQMVSSSNADVSRKYLEKVADLLLEFAQADTSVKSYMSVQSLLTRLFQMFNKMEHLILLKSLKCINHLSTDPNCLENLQRTDAIKYLIPNLALLEGPLVFQIHSEVLKTLFNLCKINKTRQEQAAENGIIPHLMEFIVAGSPLNQYALPLMCDLAHASRSSREQLRVHGGLDVYLDLLGDEAWCCGAFDSLAVCLALDNDQRKVEQDLLRKEAIQKLVRFFQNCPELFFVNILEPFLKIMTKSPRINTAMATNGLTSLLVARLGHHDAIARLNLLKLIKVVYEHHPRPKQLIVENDLPQKLQDLIEERREGQRSGGQVLVKQMATALLKALYINSVL